VLALFAVDDRAPGGGRIASVRLALLAFATVLAATFVCLCLAQSAGAVVTTVNGHQFGIQPEKEGEPQLISEPLSYENGPVVHSTAPYALYWDQHSGRYHGDWQQMISGFIEGAGRDSGALGNDFAVITQYRDTSGEEAAYNLDFRGAYTDTDAYPASGNCSEGTVCLTDAQIRAELTKYITATGLPTGLNPTGGPTPIYYVFTPPGVNVCLEGSGERGYCASPSSAHPLCSYHSFIPAGGGLSDTVLYAVEPWTVGNYGSFATPQVSGSNCQDGSGTMQEPNQIGLGPEGEYSAGLSDLIVNNVADEALSTATNPLFNAWHDGGDHEEVVDKCRNDFLGGELKEVPPPTVEEHTEAGKAHNQTIGGLPYYINDVFDQAAAYAPYPGVPCINGVSIDPAFTIQNTVRTGDVATFNASESNISLGIQRYIWNFGDGTGTEVNCEKRVPTNGYPPQECTSTSGTNLTNPVASTSHVYTYGGSYTVSLTVTDDAGNTASVEHTLKVSGPAPPVTPSPKEGGTGTGTSGSSTTAAKSAPGTSPITSTPPAAKQVIATQAVASRSLATTLREGIVVRYSVSEQVAGRFEVLLASSIARRAGLRGATATGLAKGTPAQTIIAKAILVTTKGGHSTYKIKFTKATAAKLRKLGTVTLMIRLVVHNASSPTSTTVLNTVNLR
jgi:PKD repeat protein